MKRSLNLPLHSVLALLALSGCCTAMHAMATPPLTRLAQASCQSQADSKYPGAWPASWQAFQTHAKACPLQIRSGQKAEVWLLSVWAEDYLSAHPEVKDWPSFPRPLIVDRTGRCLAVLPELFPFDEPRTLTVSYERTRGGYPRQITVRVENPAEGGSYKLPVLKWDARQKQYRAAGATNEHKAEETVCPN